MHTTRTLAPLFEACTQIGNQVADHDGFVSVRRLLERFRTTLRLRPLLVEGMIGSTQSAEGQLPEWTVLIDSERYPEVEDLIDGETLAKPLPARFRFTVAHELAHSLSFRTGEFGVKLEGIAEDSKSKSEMVEAIEKTTDRLAPLLLCPERVLCDRLRSLEGPLDLPFLAKLRRDCGISREVLLNRLSLSRAMDQTGLWQRPHLRDFGVAIGEWNTTGQATLRRWPVFFNFSRLVPKGLLTLTAQDKMPFEAAFGKESLSAIQSNAEVILPTAAGTTAAPEAGQMFIEISAESTRRAPGVAFLIFVRNSQIREEVQTFEEVRKSGRLRSKTSSEFGAGQAQFRKP